jgi:transketolase
MSTVIEQEKAGKGMSEKNHADFGAGLTGKALDELCVNTIKTLTIDAVQKAESGHPGLPMGCGDFAYVLWTRYLKHNPADPRWKDRDRFVLSAGHGSMLLYALLHLCGYESVSLEDIKNFRQWGSTTPGHPEHRDTPGVETTTGPLGQGAGNSVGLAIAEAWQRAVFGDIVDHHTYVIVSDGDLMEGVTAEAVSLAGHLGLNRLIFFYDDNRVSIEGCTELAYSDDVASRFEGYHWNVISIDGHDHEEIVNALDTARAEKDRPTIIIGKTIIGKGSPKHEGTPKAHSDAFGVDEVAATKRNIGWPDDAHFLVPDAVRKRFSEVKEKGIAAQADWKKRFDAWAKTNADKAATWEKCWNKTIPADLAGQMPKFDTAKPDATRNAGGKVLELLFKTVPGLIGGSADLAPSTKTWIKDYGSFQKENRSGRNLHFGVREHGMGAVLNGLAYHGGFIPFGSTFFIFTDYMRPAMRLAALGHLQVIYVLTHDSIFVGEDGPTHEPVEHIASFRAMPNMTVIRPSDSNETAYAWIAALTNRDGPTCLLLTRQNLPVIDQAKYGKADGLLKGAYVVAGAKDEKILFLATGSEVSLALQAHERLKSEGIGSRVVAMPSWEIFEKQDQKYKDSVIPPALKKRLAVEAGVELGWQKYLGGEGVFIGMSRFGASAPYKVLAEKFGFTVENVLAQARQLLG